MTPLPVQQYFKILTQVCLINENLPAGMFWTKDCYADRLNRVATRIRRLIVPDDQRLSE